MTSDKSLLNFNEMFRNLIGPFQIFENQSQVTTFYLTGQDCVLTSVSRQKSHATCVAANNV